MVRVRTQQGIFQNIDSEQVAILMMFLTNNRPIKEKNYK